MTMRCPAKLIGGRFDGDAGIIIVEKVPEYIWVYSCPGPSTCPDRIHWALSETQAHEAGARPADMVIYEFVGFDGVQDEMPIAAYSLPTSPVSDLDSDREREILHA